MRSRALDFRLLLARRRPGPAGPENLIDNGTFDSAAGWTITDQGGGTNIIADGKLTFGENGTAFRDTNSPLVEGLFYQVEYTVSDFEGSAFQAQLGGTNGLARSANGTYSELIRAGPTQTFVANGGPVLSVDDIVVTGPVETPLNVELVVNGGFDSADGWTLGGANPANISGGTLNAAGGSGTKTCTQTSSIHPVNAGTYEVTFTLVSRVAGTAFFSFAGSGTGRPVPGTYTEERVISDTFTQTFTLAATSGATLSMDNFSVKRIA